MKKTKIIKGRYADSITLMLITEELKTKTDAMDAVLNMASQANLNIMRDGGFETDAVDAAPDDLIIAIEADEEKIEALFSLAEEWLVTPPWLDKDKSTVIDTDDHKELETNLALISVSGKYAAVEALKNLEEGKNVMIFSDNVSLEDERLLKNYAHERQLLVMGPDCGTAVVNGVGLGFSNAGKTGPVGIIGASGTGIQETYILLQKRGIGVLHAIGTGGRDIKDTLGGISFIDALGAVWEDPRISLLVCVSKPLSQTVMNNIENAVLELGNRFGNKPIIFCYVGGNRNGNISGKYYCTDFEETAMVAEALVQGNSAEGISQILQSERNMRLKSVESDLDDRRIPAGYLRGFYTGGTLCYEAQTICSKYFQEVWSNIPLKSEKTTQNPLKPEGHCLIDYGEDAFTQGRLHPMIDPSLRNNQLKKQALQHEVGVILFDVVLGYGCHPDPAEELAVMIKEVLSIRQKSVCFVCSITGLETDPQNASEQRAKLERAGVLVCRSNAEAAFIACGLLKEVKR
jgi:succinyl-CoA synthetase alpha subunit